MNPSEITRAALASAVSLLGPWQHKVTHMSLISEYFQPNLNAFVSVAVLLVAVWAVLSTSGRISNVRVRKRLIYAISLFVLFGTICFVLMNTAGEVSISKIYRIILWLFWVLAYTLTFVSLAAAVGFLSRYIPIKPL